MARSTQIGLLAAALVAGALIAAVTRIGPPAPERKHAREPTAARFAAGPTMPGSPQITDISAGKLPAHAFAAQADEGSQAGAAPNEINPHAKAPATADAIPIGQISQAPGALGHTVAELYAARASLATKAVRVRAVVVKVVPGVMGKTFLHVRDGSGTAASGNHDLAVTTDAQPKLGDRLLLEGTLAVDVDFGAGYRYPVIVQDARVLNE
jgi:hypothetical protein